MSNSIIIGTFRFSNTYRVMRNCGYALQEIKLIAFSCATAGHHVRVEEYGCWRKVRVHKIFPVFCRLKYVYYRRELCEVVQAILYNDSSESSDSSDDETEILLHALFPLRERLYDTRLCFEDITEYECERLFRYAVIE